jgi:hypothetical protein
MLTKRGVDFSKPVKLPNGGESTPKDDPKTAPVNGRVHSLFWAAFTLTGQTEFPASNKPMVKPKKD